MTCPEGEGELIDHNDERKCISVDDVPLRMVTTEHCPRLAFNFAQDRLYTCTSADLDNAFDDKPPTMYKYKSIFYEKCPHFAPFLGTNLTCLTECPEIEGFSYQSYDSENNAFVETDNGMHARCVVPRCPGKYYDAVEGCVVSCDPSMNVTEDRRCVTSSSFTAVRVE